MSYDNDQRGFSNQEPQRGGYQQQSGGYNKGGYQNNGGGYNSGGYQKKAPVDRDAPLPEPVFYKPYAVVGNRDFPMELMPRLTSIIKKLDSLGYTARTGSMKGLDTSVEDLTTNVELQLPWKNFNDKESKTTFSSPEIISIAKYFQPGFDELKLPIKGFLAKNVRVLLGSKGISRAIFLLCHSEDGVETARQVTSRTASVGHAIKVADKFNIPVFNLQNPSIEEQLMSYLNVQNDTMRPVLCDDLPD